MTQFFVAFDSADKKAELHEVQLIQKQVFKQKPPVLERKFDCYFRSVPIC